MLRMNKNKVFINSAKIIFNGKVKFIFQKKELKKLQKQMERMQEEADAKMILDYMMNGGTIQLDKKTKEIHLFGPAAYGNGRVEPTWSIEKNPELYSLLKSLF